MPRDANVVINYKADLGAVRAFGAEVRGALISAARSAILSRRKQGSTR